ncbi:hypothetical protein EST38_g14011 [Candolleomyces aberdarensis]|uniref:Uncharacterized protein n=1 Tax=Candolleomyces aberdarensis TaxID=2316362 RepID=A0A4Q2D0T4_9AGAR|nr:hypothetical protein EST38_g14011 [Candolleomyces aberdarensis]
MLHEDLLKFSSKDYDQLTDVIVAYQVLSIFAPSNDNICGTSMGYYKEVFTVSPSVKIYDKRLFDWVTLILTAIQLLTSLQEEEWEHGSSGLFAALMAMQRMKDMSGALAILENFQIAALHLFFILSGATSSGCGLEISNLPGNAAEIIAATEQATGLTLSQDNHDYITELLRKHSISGLRFPLLVAVLISPLVLLLPLKLVYQSCPKILIAQSVFKELPTTLKSLPQESFANLAPNDWAWFDPATSQIPWAPVTGSAQPPDLLPPLSPLSPLSELDSPEYGKAELELAPKNPQISNSTQLGKKRNFRELNREASNAKDIEEKASKRKKHEKQRKPSEATSFSRNANSATKPSDRQT